MDSLLLSFNVVAPLFLLMLAGFLCRRAHIFGETGMDAINKLINYVLLPAMLFLSLYRSDLNATVNLPLLGFVFGAVSLTVGALVLVVPRLVRSDARRGAAIQGMFRANSSIFATSLALMLFGSGDLGQMPFLIALVVVLYNIYAVLVLERYRGRNASVLAMLRSILTNPLIIGVCSGLLFSLLPIELPKFILTAADALSSATTGLGFLMLGASFTFASARANRRILTGCVAAKLVLIPLVWLAIAVLLGYRGHDLTALMILFCAPTAISTFTLAKEMGADADLAGEIVVFTSAFSIVSVFLWILVLSTVGLI